MYSSGADPYCYKGTRVLKNRLGLREQASLDAFEAEATAQRFMEPLPVGSFTPRHYRSVHRHIFGDVYRWAGRYRRIRIAKGSSMFCYPENIDVEMRRVFSGLLASRNFVGLSADRFAHEAAHFLAELNAIHPFRDGNGRAQMAFIALLALSAGFSLQFQRLEPQPFLDAMIASFQGDEAPLAEALRRLIARPRR